MRPLTLAILLAAGCATQLPPVAPVGDMPGDMLGVSADLTGTAADMTDTASWFVGAYVWDNQGAMKQTVCDSGTTVDPPPTGGFRITPGPGAGQVNIGVGSTSCPTFLFDVSGHVATLANAGDICQSGPGTASPGMGSLTTNDAGLTLSLALTINLSIPRGDGTINHCVVSVSGTLLRK